MPMWSYMDQNYCNLYQRRSRLRDSQDQEYSMYGFIWERSFANLKIRMEFDL